ncbi:MAG: hypothetical protein JSS86_25205 [Cyanobacteria bacterium SZAS LIN-2]|nr:hypothetical protein [Cyanobacteria bacterium SZAS LIN-2]
MKRTLWGLCAALSLAFIGLVPSQANAAVGCANQTVTGYLNQVLFTCDGVTPTDVASSKSGLTSLPPQAITANDTAKHKTYVFAFDTDYEPYTVAHPGGLPYQDPQGAQGYTFKDANGNWWSLVFINKLTAAATKHTENAITHEQGHYLDYWWSSIMGGAQSGSENTTYFNNKLNGAQFTVGGGSPVVVGHTITATFDVLDGLAGSPTYNTYVYHKVITKTIAAGDTIQSVAAFFVDQINNNSDLKLYGVIAVPAVAPPTPTPTFYIHSPNIVHYQIAHVGNFLFDTNQGRTSLHDWSTWINRSAPYGGTDAQCKAGGGGIFNGKKDSTPPSGAYICSGTNGNGATLSANYAGLDNAQILLKAWGYFYQQTNDYGYPRWAELWAEETAFVSSAPEGGNFSPDFPFTQGFFACTREVLTYVYNNTTGSPKGGLPPNDNTFGSTCKGLN